MIVNRRDVDFYLDEMFDLGSLLASDRYSEHDRESVTAVLDLCQNMAEEEFLPCAAEHDENEPGLQRRTSHHPRLTKRLA
jgi:hypothetical protein